MSYVSTLDKLQNPASAAASSGKSCPVRPIRSLKFPPTDRLRFPADARARARPSAAGMCTYAELSLARRSHYPNCRERAPLIVNTSVMGRERKAIMGSRLHAAIFADFIALILSDFAHSLGERCNAKPVLSD